MVYYDKKGNIQYAKFANSNIRRVVKDLRLTETGNSQLRNLINSKTNVRVNLSNEVKISNNHYTYGKTIQGNLNSKDNYGKYIEGNLIKINNATITVYVGTIKEGSTSKFKILP